jgi:hypothetical protein
MSLVDRRIASGVDGRPTLSQLVRDVQTNCMSAGLNARVQLIHYATLEAQKGNASSTSLGSLRERLGNS